VYRIWLLCAVLTLSACAMIPEDLTSGGVPVALITPQQAQTGSHDGERVRWGGVIIKTTPQANRTCFEVAGLSLGRDAAPEGSDYSIGRFIACGKGFYEPTFYESGREVTFTGLIEGTEKQKVGEFLYDFPRLAFDAVHLWPKRSEVIYVPYYDPRFDPF